jgi:L-ascorbate metabolism protein UlaG (beta-lactamase superfamily)
MNSQSGSMTRWWVALWALITAIGGVAAEGPPEFSGCRTLTNGEVQIELSAAAGAYCQLESSSDLAGWSAQATVRTNTGRIQYVDSSAPFREIRFYRAQQLEGTNYVTGDHLTTDAGDVVIHPVNHAAVLLSWSGRTIVVDPGDSAARFNGLPRADLVLLTHGHTDHFVAGTVAGIKVTNAVIVAPPIVYAAMSAALKSATCVLTNGASTNLLGIGIEAIPAYNLTSSHHPKGEGNGYILTVGGRRLYFAGDTEDIPEMRALRGIDVAFVCMNLPYTMTVAKAVSAVAEFAPRVVYPYHFSVTSNATSFKQQLGTTHGIEVRLRKWY